MSTPIVKSFFDEATHTVSYVVSDPETQRCAIIDSVLDFDGASGHLTTQSADQLIDYIQSEKLQTDWIIDTHIHADHLTAAQYLQSKLGGQTAIGEKICDVRDVFGDIFNAEKELQSEDYKYDHLFKDGESYTIGNLQAYVIHTPGHTPACMTHVIEDTVFVGDTLFMPDYGSARCDFPGGDAKTLYQSIQKLFALPDSTRMFLCHDYKTAMRQEFAWETTVGEQKAKNIHVRDGVSEAEFVAMRTQRDAGLGMPKLIVPSVQVNICAGRLPIAESNGRQYLKIPINTL